MSLDDYNILNSVKELAEQISEPYALPFKIYNKTIIPTYREIQLKYVRGYNFFINKEDEEKHKKITTKNFVGAAAARNKNKELQINEAATAAAAVSVYFI